MMMSTVANLLPTGGERVLLTIGGAIGGAFSFAFGNVGPLLVWLLIFTVSDFILGTGIAIKQGQWSSHKNYMGVMKKFLMFMIVALSHGLDEVFQPLIHIQIFQSITICAYCAGEFGSLIETLERGGFGSVIPPVLRRIVRTVNHSLDEKVDLELKARGLVDADEGESNGGKNV